MSTDHPQLMPLCFVSDVQQLLLWFGLCHQGFAQVGTGKRRAARCMKGIGCSDGESKGATVGLRCECGKAKP